MTITVQDLYGSIRGVGRPTSDYLVEKDEDDSLLAYIRQRRNTNLLNLEVLRAHRDDIRFSERSRIDWLRADLAACDKAIAMLTGDFN